MAEAATATPAPSPAPEAPANDNAPEITTDAKPLSGLTLDDLIPAKGSEESKGDEQPANDNETQPETKEPKAEEQVTAEQLFTAEALSTPEGVGRAREILLAAKSQLFNRHQRLDRFDTRLKRQAKELRAAQAEIEPVRNDARRFISEVKSLRAESGLSAKDRFVKMARLVGEDPQEFYESVSMGIITDGKQAAAPKSKEYLALEKQLADIQAERQRERDQWAEQQQLARVEQMQARLTHLTEAIANDCSNAASYPTLADQISQGGVTPGDAADWVVQFMTDHHRRTGVPLDRSEAIATLEARLARAVGGSVNRAPQGETRSGSRIQRPGSSASNAGKRAVTVTPTLADRSTGTSPKKPMKADKDWIVPPEHLDEIARDPELLAALGFDRFL